MLRCSSAEFINAKLLENVAWNLRATCHSIISFKDLFHESGSTFTDHICNSGTYLRGDFFASGKGALRFNQIALASNAAPGVNDSSNFKSVGQPAINATGDVAFRAYLQTGAGPVVFEDNDSGIFGPIAGPGSPLGLLARENDDAPGASDNAEFDMFGSPVLGDDGSVAFYAELRTGTGVTVTNQNRAAIFGPASNVNLPFGLLAREGTLAPGLSDGAEFNNFIAVLKLNSVGEVVFYAGLRTGSGAAVTPFNNTAIFTTQGGVGSPLKLLARADTLAPGVTDEANFGDLSHSSVVLNDLGATAFFANLITGAGPAVTEIKDSALFGPSPGNGSLLGLIAREGDPALGTSDDAVFGSVFTIPVINSAGDIAFYAPVRTGTGTPVTSNNNRALFGPSAGTGSH